MKVYLDRSPLNVYNQSTSKNLLKEIESEVGNVRFSRESIAQGIISSFVSKASGVGLLSYIDKVSIGFKGDKARKCLSDLIEAQINRIKGKPTTILMEAQLNLMTTSCVMNYLCYLESSSWDFGVKNVGKVIIGLLDFENPLNVLAKSVGELSDKYDDICQVYYNAFLLSVYDSINNSEAIIKSLIRESLCDDCEGESSLSLKKLPILFSDVQYKSLEDNLKYRLSFVIEKTKWDDIYDPFVRWRKDLNSGKL